MKGESPVPHEARGERAEAEKTISVRDFFQETFRHDLEFEVRKLSPEFQEDGRGMADLFRQEILDLITPEAQEVQLNHTQTWYLRSVVGRSFSVEAHPELKRTYKGEPVAGVISNRDQEKLLMIATYINSLERKR